MNMHIYIYIHIFIYMERGSEEFHNRKRCREVEVERRRDGAMGRG